MDGLGRRIAEAAGRGLWIAFVLLLLCTGGCSDPSGGDTGFSGAGDGKKLHLSDPKGKVGAAVEEKTEDDAGQEDREEGDDRDGE